VIRTDPALVGRFAAYANRTFWRNPAAAFFTLFLPVFFLVLFSVLFGNEPLSIDGRTVSSATFTVAGIITCSVVGACYTNLATAMTFSRETGFLKRIRGTPIPPWTFLTGRIIHAVGVVPFSNQPRWLDILTSVLPIKPFNEALKTAIVPPLGSNGFNGGDLLELAVWGVVGAVVAFRYFSWEPHP
jgi:hypothetical protein